MAESTDELLDLQRLRTLVEEIGDRDLVRQAVQAFLDEVPERLANIRVALAGGEADELRSAAHALGSPAAMLGAVAVAATSRALQTAAAQGRADDTRTLVEDITRTTQRTEVAMRAYLDESVSA